MIIKQVSIVPASVAETCVTGTSAVKKITLPAFAGATSGDYVVIYDGLGGLWGVALDKTGSAPAPTGVLWASVAVANKVKVDISTATTANEVALLVQTALVGITGISASITVGTVSTADIPLTMIDRGPTTTPVPKNTNDSGAGSITGAQTTAGVASAINITTDIITLASTSFITGEKVAVTINSGTLPGPLTATHYYAIRISANTIQLATTQANAVAGVAINLADQGDATKTITLTNTVVALTLVEVGNFNHLSLQSLCSGVVGALSLQVSNDGISFVDVNSSSQNVTATVDDVIWELDTYSRYIRQIYTISSGTGTIISFYNIK